MWLLLWAALLSSAWTAPDHTAVNNESAELPGPAEMAEGDNGGSDVPPKKDGPMQSPGAGIPPNGTTENNGQITGAGGIEQLLKQYIYQTTLAEKQAEIEKLKKEIEHRNEMDELRKKNEELAERLRKLEQDKEVLGPKQEAKQTDGNKTIQGILIFTDNMLIDKLAVLSADRAEWTKLHLNLPFRLGNCAVYLNGEIYLIGANSPGTLFKLDRNLEWHQLADMNIGRDGISSSCLAWDGYIWVFGGYTAFKIDNLKSVERYDPKENTWTLMTDMPESRWGVSAVVWNNGIVITGGAGLTELSYSEGEEYHPATNTVYYFHYGIWTKLLNMPVALRNHCLVTYKNRLIVMGGFDGHTTFYNVWELDPLETDGKWRSLPAMKYSATYFSGVVLDEEVYAIGGRDASEKALKRVEIFDGASWRNGTSVPYNYALPAIIIPQSLADRLIAYKPEE